MSVGERGGGGRGGGSQRKRHRGSSIEHVTHILSILSRFRGPEGLPDIADDRKISSFDLYINLSNVTGFLIEARFPIIFSLPFFLLLLSFPPSLLLLFSFFLFCFHFSYSFFSFRSSIFQNILHRNFNDNTGRRKSRIKMVD